jgi:DNA-binding NarL/FixJ family response regulator
MAYAGPRAGAVPERAPAPHGGEPRLNAGIRPCRVYIVSDVRLYREGLSSSLAAHRDLDMAGNGPVADALHRVAQLAPDVLLLDVAAPRALQLTRPAVAVAPGLRVVAFAVAEIAADVLACAEAGICGYVAKDGSVEDVVAAVLRARSGELVCSPRIAASLFERVGALSTRTRPQPALDGLTCREIEIARLVARGLSNKAIARDLRLSVATIKNHVHNVLQKLQLERRGDILGRGPDTRTDGLGM